jgi:antitoxin ParD1/3/4
MMHLVTVHLPEDFVERLDELVRLKRYPNRSEAIRVGLRDFLREEGFWPATGKGFAE